MFLPGHAPVRQLHFSRSSKQISVKFCGDYFLVAIWVIFYNSLPLGNERKVTLCRI